MSVHPSLNLAELLTIPEAAKRTPLTEGQLQGYLPSVRWGGRIFVRSRT